MIAPLGAYALRGVAWYQGESNAGSAGQYQKLLAGLMGDWRRQFGAELPFHIFELPNSGPAPASPVASYWACLREAQRRAVAGDRHAALVVTIDIGDRQELHPPNKQEIGRRLARAARHLSYGEDLSPSGPIPAGGRRQEGRGSWSRSRMSRDARGSSTAPSSRSDSSSAPNPRRAAGSSMRPLSPIVRYCSIVAGWRGRLGCASAGARAPWHNLYDRVRLAGGTLRTPISRRAEGENKPAASPRRYSS